MAQNLNQQQHRSSSSSRGLSSLSFLNSNHCYQDHHSHHQRERASSSSLNFDTFYRTLSSTSGSSNDNHDVEIGDKTSDNDDTITTTFTQQPKHKHAIPPMKPPPGFVRTTTIIEPPVRSRPFRPFSKAGRNKKQQTKFPSGGKKKKTHTKTVITPDNAAAFTTPPSNHNKLISASYPVQAVQIAQQIDLAQAISKVFATKGLKRMMERLSVVVELPPTVEGAQRFIAVFGFGSVVFFNVAPKDVATYIQQLKFCAVDPILSGNEFKENFCVHVQPPTDDETILGNDNTTIREEFDENNHQDEEDIQVVSGDYCIVQELNMKAVDVISNIMAQSVALDSYNDTVDELLANFEKINAKVVTGPSNSLSDLDRDKMFQAVARNNSIFIEMVSRVGIKDRIDTAWNLSQYEDIHDGLKEEFDIDQRFEHIEFKLNLIQQNAKFFLEVLANQKSNTLEWMIIVLIMFECVLMCMEMSGVGQVVFGSLGDQLLNK